MEHRDYKSIFDLREAYPLATLILEMPYEVEEDVWSTIAEFNKLYKPQIILALTNLNHINQSRRVGSSYFYDIPVSTFYRARAIVDAGVCYLRITAPLFFDFPLVKELGVPVRACPNVAYDDGLPRPNGLSGTWIRPEDLDTIYGDYIAVAEFGLVDLDKEAKLFDIYAVRQTWNLNLDLIIENLDLPLSNPAFTSRFATMRLTCRQRCERSQDCHACYLETLFQEAEEKILEKNEKM